MVFNNYLFSIYESKFSSYIITSDQDLNANRCPKGGKCTCSIKNFGLRNRNAKGVEALNF